MDASIFKKMRMKTDHNAKVFYAPSDYPKFEECNLSDSEQVDFVHLFVESKEQFEERFSKAVDACIKDALLWISYPKSKGKITYDINRDSLWGLLLNRNYHPVSQVSLDDKWSAVRVKINEDCVTYEKTRKC